MGTLVARGYMQKYDNEIEKIIFTDELVDDWTYPLIQPN